MENGKKSDTAKREEEILAFWKENDIFNKSLTKDSPKGRFVFYDGPPFATGLPHTGSLLSSVVKDAIPRYKTMRGYHVRRRWGWDCHGLPIESLIEKRLNLKTKKDIERIGVDVFNEAARSSVLEFEHEWEKYIERVGRWVDFKNSYKTMDNTYIESVWWGLKRLHESNRLYEGKKVLMYCTHCETPLAKAEIAMDNTYKDITEEAVTVKFKVKNPEKHNLPQNTYVLAWTTTPWTLPGNVALAVGSDIEYRVVEIARPERKEYFILAAEPELETRVFEDQPDDNVEFLKKTITGKDLVGVEYEPIFDVPSLQGDKSYKIYAADFVNTEDGTGIVHTAVMYGEDDFTLGQKEGLPMIQLLTPSGTYNDLAPEFVRGAYIKDAERDIKRELESRGVLFDRKNHTHSYPHCYRCGTPLIYNAVASWFIDIQGVKKNMLSENEKINWVPEHLKHGRFKHIVESAPDWTISRNRFWASPLPIWKEKGGQRVMVIGSVDELRQKVKKSGNRYFVLRHGESESNVKDIVNGDRNAAINLTEEGRQLVLKSVAAHKGIPFNAIYVSPFLRTRQTAEIAAEVLNVPAEKIIIDERLREVEMGEREGAPRGDFLKAFPERIERFERAPRGGENYIQVRQRMGQFLYEIEETRKNQNILIVSHGTPLWMLVSAARGESKAQTIETHAREYPIPGIMQELPFVPLPVNHDYELDLHRPYTDNLVLVDDVGREYGRIPEVVDCWVESGSMPFAEYHYPFENKKEFEQNFPGDFIAEYIAQTRTWFYYMHALGNLLFKQRSFKNVVTTGTILASDGSKMSKSKGNYTDPLALLDQFGADALRFHLLGSVVMQAEDLNFRDEDVRDAHNRMVGILWNSFKFFELYKSECDSAVNGRNSPHVLDRWIYARLDETVAAVTEVLDQFDTPGACRVLKAFVEDYSTWYVRRSRDRMRGETADKHNALSTQKEVLITLSKLVAPIMPFLAESMYQGSGGSRESVHLEAWPEVPRKGFLSRLFGRRDTSLIEGMESVRRVVSSTLQMRSTRGIKVRQPLASLGIAATDIAKSVDRGALLSLVAEEVNVKSIHVLDTLSAGEIDLDTELTPELIREGEERELLRAVQGLRKAEGLKPGDIIEDLHVFAGGEARTIIDGAKMQLRTVSGVQQTTFTEIDEGEPVTIAGHVVKLRIKK